MLVKIDTPATGANRVLSSTFDSFLTMVRWLRLELNRVFDSLYRFFLFPFLILWNDLNKYFNEFDFSIDFGEGIDTHKQTILTPAEIDSRAEFKPLFL